MKIKYGFDHDGGRWDFGSSFRAEQLNIGGDCDLSFESPFNSTTVYQVGSGLIKPKPFLLEGIISGNTTTWQAEIDLNDLQEALETCTKLYNSDIDGSNEAYVLCDKASQPIVKPITPTKIKVRIAFWPSRLTWKLSSDDSETFV